METHRAARMWAPGLAQICAALSVLIGLTIVLGWELGYPGLVRFHASFAAVPYNTALVLILVSTALFASARGRPVWALCALPAVVYCFLTLGQALFGWDLGIDQMLFPHRAGSRPGRMAPVTALAFSFAAVSIMVSGIRRKKHLQVPFAVLISSALVALSAAVFATCLLNLGIPRRFFFAMAPGTALGLMLLGVGTLALFWRHEPDTGLSRWLPAPIGVGAGMIVLVLYQALEADTRRQAEKVAAVTAARVEEHIRLSLQASGYRILAVSKKWQDAGACLWNANTLRQEARHHHVPGLLGLEVLSSQMDVRWTAPQGGFAGFLQEPADGSARRDEVLKRALQRNGRALSHPINLVHGGLGVLAALPRVTLGKVVAWELVLLDAQAWLSGIMDKSVVAGFGISVVQDDQLIFRSPEANDAPEPASAREALVRQGSAVWNVRIWPTPRLIAANQSTVPRVALGVGLLLAGFLALTTHLAQKASARARDASASHRSLEAAHERLRVEMDQRLQAEEQLRHSQRIEAVGRLAGGVAHDFNNMLTVIVGYSDLLLRGLPAPDPLRPAADAIAKTAEQASALTRQLLAFARKQILSPKLIDLNTVLESTEVMLRRLLAVNIELRIVAPAGAGRVFADPIQIQQIILNLAINARDAMPKGGTLTIEVSQVNLDQVGQRSEIRPGEYVLLSVTDSGSGMAPETRTRLFEPFFTTKELGRGTGLGLATVHGIVKQSGGHIEVESELGRGSCFKVYLPRANGSAS